MIDAAPRITAGYDADAPREIVFPPAARRDTAPVPVETDPAVLAADLAAVLTRLCGVEVAVAAMAGPALPGLAGWCAADGRACALGGGILLAAALLSRECGGSFEGAAGTARSAHVVRRADLLATGLRNELMPDAAPGSPVHPARRPRSP